MAFGQESWTTPDVPHPGFPSSDKGSPRPPQAPTNSRQIQHFAEGSRLLNRLGQHAAGRGARPVEVITQAGITFRLARTWPGVTRARERQLENQGGASRRCPICLGQPATPGRRHDQPALSAPAVPTRGTIPA
jgi:hypothetical protein